MRYILNNYKLTKNENTIFLTDDECEKELLSELVFLSKKVTDFRNKFLDKKQARLALASFGGQYQVSYFDLKTDNISKFKKMVNKLIPVFKETEIKEYRCMSSIGINTLGKLATIAPPNSLKEEFNTNKENTSVTNNQEQVIKKEDVDKKIKEFQEKDKLTEPIIFEFLKTNYDKYIASEDRINRLNNFDINQTNQDIKPQNLMPDFITKQLGNK